MLDKARRDIKLDEIKLIIGIEKRDCTKILIDPDDKLGEKVILITVVKDHDPQLFHIIIHNYF